MPHFNHVISSVIGDQPDRVAVRDLVEESHKFAMAYLWKKVRQQRLLTDMFRLSVEDLALDCIADLFQRDEEGRFNQIATYFESVKWEDLDEAGLQIALRRLVFSKVNEGLFRRYREADPSLAKIIRNLKNAAKGSDQVYLDRQRRELMIVAETGDAEQETLPTAPVDVLESHLIAYLSSSDCDSLKQVVAGFVDFVACNPYYGNAFPVSDFAQVVRAAFVHLGEAVEDRDEETFLPGVVQQRIDLVVEAVQADMRASYVGKGKVSSTTYETYFLAVRDVLASQFANDADEVDSYLDALQIYMPDLEKPEYRTHHRHVFEYLVKLSRSRFIEHMRETVVH
ncbi:MAG: hypothetical protein AAF752_00020 [Bacteroidota bacterium]